MSKFKISVFLIILVTKVVDYFDIFHSDSENLLRLEIVVLSSINNFDKRQAIRNTWKKSIDDSKNVSINLKFIIGNDYCKYHPMNRVDSYSCVRLGDPEKRNPELDFVWKKKMENVVKGVLIESNQFADIEFVEMIDVYRELPQKLLLSFKSLFDKKKYFTHLLKTDDDCYINIGSLISLIVEHKNETFAWFGK